MTGTLYGGQGCSCFDVNRAEAAAYCEGSSLLYHEWTNCISGNKRIANVEQRGHLESINGIDNKQASNSPKTSQMRSRRSMRLSVSNQALEFAQHKDFAVHVHSLSVPIRQVQGWAASPHGTKRSQPRCRYQRTLS
jgi:hypothetical protein